MIYGYLFVRLLCTFQMMSCNFLYTSFDYFFCAFTFYLIINVFVVSLLHHFILLLLFFKFLSQSLDFVIAIICSASFLPALLQNMYFRLQTFYYPFCFPGNPDDL